MNLRRRLCQISTSNATRNAQLSRQIALFLGLDGHNINNKRIQIDTNNGKTCQIIIDGDFDNKQTFDLSLLK